MDRADEVLHEFVARTCGNELLAQVIRKVRMITRRLVPIVASQRYARSAEEHLAILAAYRRRDPQMAEQAIREHVRNAKNRLLEGQTPGGEQIGALVT